VFMLCVALAGCASAKASPQAAAPPVLRGPTPEEQARVDQALAPLVRASGICRPAVPCTIGLAIEPMNRIHVAAGPAPQKIFVIRITTGALTTLDPPELQAALAHELGHVQLGHFDTRGARRLAEGAADAGSNGAGDEAVRANRASDRAEELAADRYAVELLDRLPGAPGHGCSEMLLLLERLDLEQTSPGWANWLSTHPTPDARLQALKAECEKKS